MSEEEFMDWLKNQTVNGFRPSKNFVVQVADVLKSSVNSSDVCNVVILPLSVEDNATINGTASILEEFGKEFNIDCNHQSSFLPFDENKNVFDLKAARNRYEFLALLEEHKKTMLDYKSQLDSTEKDFDHDSRGSNTAEANEDTNEESDDDDDEYNCQPDHGQVKKKKFQKIDGAFKKAYDGVVKKMWKAAHNSDPNAFEKFLKEMEAKRHEWDTNSVSDHFGRTILHTAVEDNNLTLVKTLIHVGVDVNCLEGCGASPLTLAVLNKNVDIAKILHENFALSSGPLFACMPSPHDIAKAMELDTMVQLFDTDQDYMEDKMLLQSFEQCEQIESTDSIEIPEDENQVFKFNRSRDRSCPTIIVGDNGTNKICRSVRNRESHE